jgi:hypothetical protein
LVLRYRSSKLVFNVRLKDINLFPFGSTHAKLT